VNSAARVFEEKFSSDGLVVPGGDDGVEMVLAKSLGPSRSTRGALPVPGRSLGPWMQSPACMDLGDLVSKIAKLEAAAGELFADVARLCA
jgi:hypothetical protein